VQITFWIDKNMDMLITNDVPSREGGTGLIFYNTEYDIIHSNLIRVLQDDLSQL
jgi:hypothetical protein